MLMQDFTYNAVNPSKVATYGGKSV